MQLHSNFWEITANHSKCRTRMAQEIALSLHLRQKLHWKARQKSHIQRNPLAAFLVANNDSNDLLIDIEEGVGSKIDLEPNYSN